MLGINSDPVTIERIEYEIVERAWGEGWVRPQVPRERTGKRVAVVGSGPAGLAAAQQLARAGHSVVVYRAGREAGRPAALRHPRVQDGEARCSTAAWPSSRPRGSTFRCSASVGGCRPTVAAAEAGRPEPGEERGVGVACAPDVTVVPARSSLAELRRRGAGRRGHPAPRPDVPGRVLRGVHFALEYLKPSNLVQEGALAASPISAAGKHVVIIGGGDTGADCLGTAHRQGAASVHQLEIMPEPPERPSAEHPWPVWPVILRTSSAHEEGGQRLFSVTTTELRRRRHRGGRGPCGAIRWR